MIKKIRTSQLEVGMFIHDLDCKWMDHPFMKGRFKVEDEKVRRKIARAGIKHVYIDTGKGDDLDEAPTAAEVHEEVQQEAEEVVKTGLEQEPQRTVAEEISNARAIFGDAKSIIRGLMEDVRLGKQVEVEAVAPIAERMMQSIFRNQHALTSVARIKTKDEYTFMHCVSVAGLMITFARAQGLSEDQIREVAIGSLLHDVGKIMVPDEVLNKPGKLTDDEFEIMKSHVTYSREILKDTMGITSTAMDVAAMHHERIDGTGYPLGLRGDEINIVGQMSAIVDVYDALTSVRVYKDAWEPTFTLKKMLEWSPNHFTSELIQQFIRCLGIYPVGSLVELESGLVGVVVEQGSDLLRPRLRVMYNAKQRCYINVRMLDLARVPNDRVVSAVSPQQYNIDITAFM